MSQIRDWVTFWDRQHSIYVNARHFEAHYRDIARGIVSLLPARGLRVLDFGCGDAIHADTVAGRAARLYLCEAASSVRANLARRFAGVANIAVVTPDDAAAMADGSLDVVVANSVVQYLQPAELDRLLAQWRRQLAPGGLLIVGDVIPPDVSALSDVAALLRYAYRNGFFWAAIGGLVRTLLSDYRALRARLGMACYSEAEFLARLTATGYAAERLPFNLEHNPARMSFRARPRD